MENITAGVRGEWLKFKFLKSRFGAFCDFFLHTAWDMNSTLKIFYARFKIFLRARKI